MRPQHLVAMLVVGSIALAGCNSTKEPAADTLTKARFTHLAPESQIGIVSAVLPENGLLAVKDLDVKQFAEGDTLVLLTPNRTIIGAGHVVSKTDDSLHLSYDVNEKGRAPKVGDVAMKPAL